MPSLRASIVTLLFAAHPLAAQICNGTAPFAYGPVRVGVSGQVGENLTIFEAQAAGGPRKAGVFGGFGMRRTKFVGAPSTTRSGHVGYSVPVAWSGRVEVCPMAGLDVTSGPDFEIAVGLGEESMATRATALGLGIGVKLISASTFELIPFVGSTKYWTAQDVTYNGVTSTTHPSRYTVVGGLGFVFEKSMTLRPMVSLPFEHSEARPNYGLAMSMTIPGGKVTRD